ncbi:HIT domain-containing protein [Demequina sp. TTPB684]|uniref:HIT family protein n=1 Tax=unclassified Demequina TaxID=2620311 RepID=UPI001CF3C1BA|nr:MULTISPECIES: HIT domain-containing protein [unclassified Demequina]MCB2414088.1 HIT domain-containing protein [Demequina sp. TTPB684]UPU89201.1 HIT domain-containing protein [Demequina sp. TMPB413]
MVEWADADTMGGEPDGFERLWTPHRMAYVRNASDRADVEGGQQCPLCKTAEDVDRDHLIVHRGETCYVVLNLFPYNPGHLMICPYRHVGWYTDVTDAERDEIAALTQTGMRVLQSLTGTQGFNIGINQGKTGGAGIHEHLHQHVVPRWVGDSNFLPIIGQTKALPELLDDTWQRVSDAWPKAA